MEHRASVGSPRSRGSEPLLRRLIGGVLRRRREAQGRTLRDVAEDARVSVAYLSEIERGRKEASSEVLVAVCGALGMRLVDLVAAAYAELTGVTLGVRPEPAGGAPAGAAVLELSGAGPTRSASPSRPGSPTGRSGSTASAASSATVARGPLDAVVLAA